MLKMSTLKGILQQRTNQSSMFFLEGNTRFSQKQCFIAAFPIRCMRACTTEKAQRDKLTNTNLPLAAKSISFCCSLKKFLERQ